MYSAKLLRQKPHRPCNKIDRSKVNRIKRVDTKAGSKPFRTNIAVILATLDMSVATVPTIINVPRGDHTECPDSNFPQRGAWFVLK